MSIRSRALSLWWNLAHRDRVEQSLDDELRTYVDLAAREYENAGLPPGEARRRAVLDAGGVEQVKENVRDAWLGNTIAMTWRDVRYSLRSLRRSPGFTVIAIGTLAVGIAAATAVFSIINAVLIRPLPAVVAPDRLVTLLRVQPKTVLEEFSYPDFRDFRSGIVAASSASAGRPLTGIAAQCGWNMRLGDATGERRGMIVDFVSGEYFDVLGVHPWLGRLISRIDEDAGRGNTILVLRYEVWRDQFHADSAIIGKSVRLNGLPFTVVGVAEPEFGGTMPAHVVAAWSPIPAIFSVPSQADGSLGDRGSGWLDLFGRLAPGASVADGQRELATIAARLALTYPTNVGRGVRVERGLGLYIEERRDARNAFALLGTAVSLLLLLACANVAGLSLVRSARRQRELASRLALGASRAALLRQLFIEGTLIAGSAAALGVLGALALVRARSLLRAALPGVPLVDASIDGRVLAFALCATISTAILVSLLPAIRAGRADPISLLKDGTSGAGRRTPRAQRALVGFQVSVSLTLLTVAALVFSAFHRMIDSDPGFDPHNVSIASVDPREEGYDAERSLVFLQQLLDRASDTPGIEAAALASVVPPSLWADRTAVFRAEEAPTREEIKGHSFEAATRAYLEQASPSFFSTMRISIVRGRGFTRHDDAGATAVAVVSRTLAQRLWPGQDPIGKLIAWPEDDHGPTPRPASEVVGVAADTRHSTLTGEPPLVMYVPLFQQRADYAWLIVRGRAGAPTARTMREIVSAVDPTIPAVAINTLSDKIGGSVNQQRTAALWMSVLGSIALGLALIGLYGIAAQSVVQRTRELALRAALGATPQELARLVLREGLWLSVGGIGFGLVLAYAAMRGVQRTLSGIEAIDPIVVIGCAFLLTLVMLTATWLPARRASRLNPVDALRCE
jgi:predicted permease